MSMTPLPTPPSRQDPVNFSSRADLFMAALANFVTEANTLAADVSSNQSSASTAAGTATTKAAEAAAARDIVMAAVNYKGDWSSLSGALNIPASVLHSGSIWMLTQNIASVAANTPGVAGCWLNVTPATGLGSAAYQNSSAFQAAFGTLAGLVKANGAGGVSAATASDIVSLIGASAVQRATAADSATSATAAETALVAAALENYANGVTLPASTDLNTVTGSGTYRTNPPTSNYPAAAATAYSNLIVVRSADTVNQILIEYSTSKMFVRSLLIGASWTPWRSIIDSSMISDGLTFSGGQLKAIAQHIGSYTATFSPLPDAGSYASVTHGGDTTPLDVTLEIICTSADGGYAEGDVLQNAHMGNGVGSGWPLCIYKNASAVGFHLASGYALGALRKDTGTAFIPAYAKWAYRFRVSF